ncbi:class A beta-lactamase [Streptomyces sp. FH025]|uniref:class A beta-lactamase n=1 Tax=Streptomyces sp. FH025 TaxID=2815937 RepID=UPI001A9D9545|nr:class A beta-lactamase [Streptomyces sp. FH025]MBO1415182.1 class A beta-lactamase [Streptomyces sp. FH025]
MHAQPSEARRSRRTVLALGVGAAVAAVVSTGGTAHAANRTKGTGSAGSGTDVHRSLAQLERDHSARLGVYGRNLVTGRTVRHRAEERFPMCSVFKTVAVAAVLRDLDRDGEFLAQRIRYTRADVDRAGGAPVTGLPGNLADGMTVGELCAAAIDHSDNTAANLLLRELGGPAAVTRFCRSIGDRTTRLDRWEPELNSAEPDRTTDTTTPHAIARTYRSLTLGHALPPGQRERLTTWLRGNTTSTHRFREGLPQDWTIADKTGTGDYGTTNDVGIAWTPQGAPVVLAVLSTKPSDPAAPKDDLLVARAAALLAPVLG